MTSRLLLLALILSACDEGPKEAPPTAVSGLVFDDQLQPLRGATVRAGEIEVKTDLNGGYQFVQAPADGQLVVSFTKEGYGRTWVQRIADGSPQVITVQLKLAPPGRFVMLPAMGESVTVTSEDQKYAVVITGGALCNRNGPANGPVDVAFVRYDPRDARTAASFGNTESSPGVATLSKRNIAGELDVLIRQGSELLDLCPGETITFIDDIPAERHPDGKTMFLDPVTGRFDHIVDSKFDVAKHQMIINSRSLFPHCPPECGSRYCNACGDYVTIDEGCGCGVPCPCGQWGVEPDCEGTCGGSAQLDCAGVCNGGAQYDCAGVCNGGAQVDCAGDCNGSAGYDCDGHCNGPHHYDCAGTCGGSAQYDCAGTCNGSAQYDCDGHCGGSHVVDCAGTCGGSAQHDCAGTCNGSATRGCDGVCNSGKVNDCLGTCGGTASGDECVCGAGVFKDCAGTCGGSAVRDCAGTCGGSAQLDCDGHCNGPHVRDCAGVCGGSAVRDCAGICGGSSQPDCAGVCNGGAVRDCAGICGGHTQVDCAGVCGGSATRDCKGVCGGHATAEDCACGTGIKYDCMGVCGGPAQKDCAGVCNGTARRDCAGVCGGTAVVGCDGVCGSGKTKDCLGVCGGTTSGPQCNCPGGIVGCDGVCNSGKVIGGCDQRCGSTKTVDCAGVCGGTAVDLGCGCNVSCPCGRPGVVPGCDGICGSGKVVGGCDNQCGSTKVDEGCGCGVPCRAVEVRGTVRDGKGRPTRTQMTASTLRDTVGQQVTDGAGQYHFRIGVVEAGKKIKALVTPAPRAHQRIEPAPAFFGYPEGVTVADFQYCLEPDCDRCEPGDKCCDGLSCQDGRCR